MPQSTTARSSACWDQHTRAGRHKRPIYADSAYRPKAQQARLTAGFPAGSVEASGEHGQKSSKSRLVSYRISTVTSKIGDRRIMAKPRWISRRALNARSRSPLFSTCPHSPGRFQKVAAVAAIVRRVQAMLQAVAESGFDTAFLQRLVYDSCVVFLVNTNAGDEHGCYEQN